MRSIALFFVSLTMFSGVCLAQVTPIEFTRNNVQAFDIYSSILNRHMVVEITYPNGYNPADTEAQFPVLYAVDGDYMFPVVSGSNRFQSILNKIPPMITVAIDYPYDTPLFNRIVNRFSDLTPVADNVEGVPFPLGGGADLFLAFINQELKPFVNSHVLENQEEEYFFGHSLGGLFGMHALLTQPDTFDRYLLGSPSVWWADKHIMGSVDAYSESALDKRVHIFVGSEERPALGEEGVDMVADASEFYWALKTKYLSDLVLTKKVVWGEDHLSVIIPGYFYGIRELMDETGLGYQWNKIKNNMEAFKMKYLEGFNAE